MNDYLKQIAELSPEQQELFIMLLKEQGVDIDASFILPHSRKTNRFPLSSAQQRLWFLDQLEPGSPLYNIPTALRLTGKLDVVALRRVLQEIMARHDILRTTFPTENGHEPVQVVADRVDLPLPVVDLRHLPEPEREAEARRLVSDHARRPFDLAHGPLVRTILLHLADDEFILMLAMHHIVADGWSMGVFVQETAALYQAFVNGRPSPLPKLAIQYTDFAQWQQRRLGAEELAKQIDYWREQLYGAPALLELPTDRPRPHVQTYRGRHLPFALSKKLTEQLNDLSQQHDATLFMTLLAALQVLLSRLSGQEDISVGASVANRPRAELESLIGFFINTLVMRADLSDDPSFADLHLTLVDGRQTVSVVRDQITITGSAGDTVSALPLSPVVEGLIYSGLRWPLQDATLPFGSTRGISNEMTGATAHISLRNGILLVIHTTRSKIKETSREAISVP